MTDYRATIEARVRAALSTFRGWGSRFVGWLRRTLVRARILGRTQHLFGLTLLVGVMCGSVAVAFHLSIRWAETQLIDRAIQMPGHSWILWMLLTPTLGGLCAGACLTWLVPGARGSGIPQVKTAYATKNGGQIDVRDAVGKFLISTLQIGSGASLGREGPTVQICAGATTLLARLTALPPRYMRRLMPVGVAAGVAAAFNAPIAAVTFTIEEIVGELDNTLLSGIVVAAALAAVIERSVLGVHPVIEVQQAYGLDHLSS
jgi:CIC family chloride channel protein